MTDSYWKIVFQYNLTQMDEEAKNLSMVMDEVKIYYNDAFQDLMSSNMSGFSQLLDFEKAFRYEYVALQQTITDYMTRLKELLTLLPRARGKRGLVDAGGHVLKFLFGTMDSNDLEVINSKIESVYDNVDEILNDNKERITILKTMHEEVVSNTKTINKVINNLKEYHKQMHETVVKLFSREEVVKVQLNHLVKYLKLHTALSEIKETVNQANNRMVRLHQGVEDLSQNKLTSNLVTPNEYLRVLHSVEQVLPRGSKLFLPVSLENIHKFYSIAKVNSYIVNRTLRVVTRLPLKNDEKLFQVYDVITFPVYNEKLTRWVEWKVDPLKLIISKDRLSYSLFKKDSFSQNCQVNELVICPLIDVVMNVYKRPHCITDLFKGGIFGICERKIISGLESPLIVRTPSRWIFSTSKPHSVTLNCYESSGNVSVTTHTISGVGELNYTGRCDVITDSMRIPARVHGESDFLGEIRGVTIPEIKSMFTGDEVEVMADNLNETLNVLQGLDEELGTLGVKEQSLEGAFKHLRSHYFFRRRVETVQYVGSGILAVLAITALLYMLRRKRRQVAAWFMRRHAERRIRRATVLAEVLRGVSLADLATAGRTSGAPGDDKTGTEIGQSQLQRRKFGSHDEVTKMSGEGLPTAAERTLTHGRHQRGTIGILDLPSIRQECNWVRAGHAEDTNTKDPRDV